MALSRPKRILCSLWMVLLIPPVLVALSILSYLQNRLIVWNKYWSLEDMYWTTDAFSLCFVCWMIPLAFFLAYLITTAREDRLVFMGVQTGYIAAVALSLAVDIFRWPWQVSFVLVVLLLLYVFGGLVLALRRRKGVLVRAELYRSQEHRDFKRAQREQRRAARADVRAQRRQQRQRKDEEFEEAERRKMQGLDKQSSQRRTVDADIERKEATSSKAAVTLDEVLGATVAAAQQVQNEAPQVTEAPDDVQSEHVEKAVATKEAAHTDSQSVDVNTCQATDLLALPGMSAAIARGIVSERETHGPYTSVQQLVERNSLKPHVVAPFIGRLEVSAPVARADGTHRARMLDL